MSLLADENDKLCLSLPMICFCNNLHGQYVLLPSTNSCCSEYTEIWVWFLGEKGGGGGRNSGRRCLTGQNLPFGRNLATPHQSDLSSYFWLITLHLSLWGTDDSIPWLLINASWHLGEDYFVSEDSFINLGGKTLCLKWKAPLKNVAVIELFSGWSTVLYKHIVFTVKSGE